MPAPDSPIMDTALPRWKIKFISERNTIYSGTIVNHNNLPTDFPSPKRPFEKTLIKGQFYILLDKEFRTNYFMWNPYYLRNSRHFISLIEESDGKICPKCGASVKKVLTFGGLSKDCRC